MCCWYNKPILGTNVKTNSCIDATSVYWVGANLCLHWIFGAILKPPGFFPDFNLAILRKPTHGPQNRHISFLIPGLLYLFPGQLSGPEKGRLFSEKIQRVVAIHALGLRAFTPWIENTPTSQENVVSFTIVYECSSAYTTYGGGRIEAVKWRWSNAIPLSRLSGLWWISPYWWVLFII